MLKSIMIWIVGVALALAAALTTMGAIAKNKAPERAVALSPLNGFASQNLASKAVIALVVANDGQFPSRIDSDTLKWAKQGFLAEPVTPEAVATLALGAGESSKRELMHKAFALTRREQLVTGWMIADSGAQDDVAQILHYYDTMLRTSAQSASVVIPIMVGGLSSERFIAPYADLLSKYPPWASQFWANLAVTPGSIVNGAALRKRVYRDTENREVYKDANLIRALAQNYHFEAAEKLYALLVDEVSASAIIRNGSFERESQYAPLDWLLASTGEYGASIGQGSLQLSGIQNSGGIFARQLVKLPPAIMQIEIKATDRIPTDVELSIGLTCAEKIDDVPKAIRIQLAEQATLRKISNKESNCNYYWLDVIGRASDSSGFDLGLESLSLRRN